MYVSMKLGYKPLIYDGFGPGDNFKKQIESVVQINQSTVVYWENGDETYLALCNYDIR